MKTLWLKFPDDILFHTHFTEEDKKKLEQIFSSSDPKSPWSNALKMLHTKNPDSGTRLIKWYKDAPYFNWSALARVIGGNALKPKPDDAGNYTLSVSYKIRDIIALLVRQWSIARFLQRTPQSEDTDKLATSIALGLAMQSLIFRLGAQAEHMEKWLADPAQAPTKHRSTIQQIQDVQMRRTHISHVWTELFPATGNSDPEDLPEFFWDDVIISPKQTKTNKGNDGEETSWTGSSVCAGQCTGIAVAIASPSRTDIQELRDLKQKQNASLILVFKHASPESTELFEIADAVLFAQGGILCHACTVAREQNLPAITKLGTDFFAMMQKYTERHEQIWLRIDGYSAVVDFVETTEIPL